MRSEFPIEESRQLKSFVICLERHAAAAAADAECRGRDRRSRPRPQSVSQSVSHPTNGGQRHCGRGRRSQTFLTHLLTDRLPPWPRCPLTTSRGELGMLSRFTPRGGWLIHSSYMGTDLHLGRRRIKSTRFPSLVSRSAERAARCRSRTMRTVHPEHERAR